MKYYAVLDTNVLVSALLARKSVPAQVLDEAVDGRIVPLYDNEILAEYEDVLRRDKFPFQEQEVQAVINAICRRGICVEAEQIGVLLPDPDDVVFYAVVMQKKKEGDAYLVTGNQKHFPREPFIVTPKEMVEIIESGAEK